MVFLLFYLLDMLFINDGLDNPLNIPGYKKLWCRYGCVWILCREVSMIGGPCKCDNPENSGDVCKVPNLEFMESG